MNFTLKRNKSFLDVLQSFLFTDSFMNFFETQTESEDVAPFLWPFLNDCFDVINNNWNEMTKGVVGEWDDLKLLRSWIYDLISELIWLVFTIE